MKLIELYTALFIHAAIGPETHKSKSLIKIEERKRKEAIAARARHEQRKANEGYNVITPPEKEQ